MGSVLNRNNIYYDLFDEESITRDKDSKNDNPVSDSGNRNISVPDIEYNTKDSELR